MIQLCEKCGHHYDDEFCWTICPHGPLWASVEAYCREHDLVNCKLHETVSVDSGVAFPKAVMFQTQSKWRTWLEMACWSIEDWVMGRLGFTWQDGWKRNKKLS